MSWFLDVNPHAVECKQFLAAISAEGDQFILYVAVGGFKTTYYIRGEPYMVDDGDGHYDDMSGSEEIHYCPFCGEEL